MHQPLNIPLTASKTTRRDSRRVVALVGGIVFGACLGVFAFRLPFAISTTVAIAPTDATTIRILKTSGSVATLTNHIGNAAIFPGAPWTLKILLTQSNRELTIVVLPNGEIAYIIDAELTEPLRNTAAAFGMFIASDGKTTTISSNATPFADPGLHAVPAALIPWHDGELWDGNRHGALVMNDHGVTLRNVGVAIEATRPTVSEDTDVTTYLSITEGSIAVPSAFRALIASPIGVAVDLLSENGGTLLLANDRLGDAYVLTSALGDLTSEEMAEIGKDITNRSSLSTQALTFQDGSVYQEIVSANGEIEPEIRAEDGRTYVNLRDTAGNIVRMTKTADILMITNREIDVLQGHEVQSTCLRRAHSWIKTSAFPQSATATIKSTDALPVFMRLFEEIAVSDTKIRLCW